VFSATIPACLHRDQRGYFGSECCPGGESMTSGTVSSLRLELVAVLTQFGYIRSVRIQGLINEKKYWMYRDWWAAL